MRSDVYGFEQQFKDSMNNNNVFVQEQLTRKRSTVHQFLEKKDNFNMANNERKLFYTSEVTQRNITSLAELKTKFGLNHSELVQVLKK